MKPILTPSIYWQWFNFGRKAAFFLVFGIVCGSPHAMSTTSTQGVTISVETYMNLIGAPVFSAERKRDPYAFGAAIEILPSAPDIKGDLYFGLLSPNGRHAFTWSNQDGEYVLVQGMKPFVEDINLAAPSSFTTSEIVGGDVKHALTENDPAGLYFVFALLVSANTSPSDTKNWIEIGLTPLLVK